MWKQLNHNTDEEEGEHPNPSEEHPERKRKENDGLFFFPVSESFLINWKFKDNKNIVQEETFSIFGDPKPGSKGFISVLKNKNSVHVCTCAMQCKHYRDSSSFGISESQMTSVRLEQLFLVVVVH